jgi:hypothetical protein
MRKSEFREHPAKVLAKMDAEWRAKLGVLYGKFFVAPGVRWPSEFNHLGEWCPLPPKKPAASIHLAREDVLLEKASGAEFSVPRHLENVTNSPLMAAATASAYPNSTAQNSEKNAPLFTRERLENLFENCDLRPHHVNMLVAMWRAAGKPHGQTIFLFAAVEGYRIEARYRSRRTVQYNLRALEKLGAIELAHGANTIRRPATYRLRVEALGKRQTYADIKNNRKSPHSISQVSSPKPPQEHASPQPQMQASAAPVAVVESERGSRQPRRLTPREGPKLVAKMAELMRGHTRHCQLDGYSFNLQPDDYRYRAPMTQEKALVAACMNLGIAYEDALEHLKLCRWTFEESEENT